MRELTKSMLSFTWSMSVFGLSQAANLLAPQRAAAAFDGIARRTEEQLGSWTRPIFNAGDTVQRGVIDLTFRAFGLDGCASCAGRRRGSCSCSRCSQRTPAQGNGWGPMPPPPGP